MPNVQSLPTLQTALSMELAAVNQYLLHAHVVTEWGLDGLATKMRAEMSEELGHAEQFLARMMFLKGNPRLEAAKVPHRAKSLVEMFQADLTDEEEAIRFYTDAARKAHDNGDIGTRALFERIVIDEEGHKAWLELQLELVQRIGEAAYIARHMTVAGETATGT